MNTTLRIDADLIALHQSALLAYASRRVREPELARDLVQETWAAAISAAPRFEGRAAVRTWLTAILRRKIVDHHRRSRPSVAFEEHHAPPTLPPQRERLDDLAALRVIDTELPALPRREREAVTLCDVEGFSRDDAADSMGVSRGALRVLLHRGRAKLKNALLEAERLAGSLSGDGLTGHYAV
jgi:RNA polymerase sigma-70 factor (ECF subfamily)